jgi:CheY-like chemotaxis protein/anti-sigma regulatory factor (Ser/Thr protein kinase)
MDQVMAAFQDKAKEKHLALLLSLDPALPESVLLDGQRLHQILNNLLDNALKFTAQGQVSLKVWALDQSLCFEVQDTGRGIAFDRQEIVFKQFEHADVQTNRAYGGTGLGLAVCERLVRLQGGEIGVRSTLGQGSVFWFKLPLKTLQAANPNTLASDTASSARSALRFLLVDDNAVNLMVARLVLQKCWPQATVSTASSGQQALEMVEKQTFDMVLMDMIMPDMDGLETTRRLRMHPHPALSGLVVIGLTANSAPRDQERCLEAGMNDVLSKPMEPAVVQATVNHWAQLHGGKPPLRATP